MPECVPIQPIFWVIFNAFVLALLLLDMGVFHKNATVIRVKEALLWSLFWVGLALCFNGLVYFWRGETAALHFLTGYLVEKALSVDNVFVFAVIFTYFKVPPQFQYRVLFYGILGALIMRAIFIFAGIALLERFAWMMYVFGGFLILTGIKMAFKKEDDEIHPENNFLVRIFKKFFRVTSEIRSQHFFIRQDGKLWATPLFIVLLVIETTDLIFAVDSIPAILAITQDSFIVYTSNVFAILGLRALYFALAGMMDKFPYLHYGLAAILAFIGCKMVLSKFYHLPTPVSLGMIVSILTISVLASLCFPPKDTKKL
jgi:tellurite resistance protein TerC